MVSHQPWLTTLLLYSVARQSAGPQIQDDFFLNVSDCGTFSLIHRSESISGPCEENCVLLDITYQL